MIANHNIKQFLKCPTCANTENLQVNTFEVKLIKRHGGFFYTIFIICIFAILVMTGLLIYGVFTLLTTEITIENFYQILNGFLLITKVYSALSIPLYILFALLIIHLLSGRTPINKTKIICLHCGSVWYTDILEIYNKKGQIEATKEIILY